MSDIKIHVQKASDTQKIKSCNWPKTKCVVCYGVTKLTASS